MTSIKNSFCAFLADDDDNDNDNDNDADNAGRHSTNTRAIYGISPIMLSV